MDIVLLPYHFFIVLLVTSIECTYTCITVGWLRSFVADYGVPLMVVVWTALSYAVPDRLPAGVPRRLFSPLPWEPSALQHWTVSKVMNL